MKPGEIKTILEQLGRGANKKLGQHFLIDESTLESIVQAADIKKGDHVLEIGPGLGVLTSALLGKGAEVTAIELDPQFADHVESHFACRVVRGDATEMDLDALMGKKKWKFVSNLPYAITSLALRRVLWMKNPPARLVVLIQKEVADRILVKDGKGSLLSLMVALSSSSARRVKKVARGAFFPPPKVESAVLEITPMNWEERTTKWGVDPEQVMKLAKRGFAHPRKMLSSNLNIDKSVLESIGVSGNARPENLSPEEWVRLASSK